MSFEVHADAYGRFMGRYSEPLAERFAALAGVAAGQRALDVGCGTGALTAELVARLGAASVSAVDPSESFVAVVRERFPAADVRAGTAERLPYGDKAFDLTLAQLVVHFMADPVAGLREMARVTRPGGVVAASVWDHAGGGSPLAVFWRAVLELDPQARDESGLAGAREGHLAELFAAAGLTAIEPSELSVRTTFADFAEWWEPFTLGVGPAGDYVRTLDDPRREALREHCATRLPGTGPIEITATAWTVVARTVSPG
ncbi:class I SAM-dependent methyltransferase [Dactylosporangium sp. McL0621]|uniref:class I SAM-dependent methyltransferase n=1 Tax=Dactylosporangium sp. McL0621 TaxID=3415678 RepID=UPI003CF0C5E3